MMIKVVFFSGGKEEQAVEMEEDSTGMELLRKLNLRPDVHILIREEIPIPLDERLSEGDSIKIISVVSGG